MKPNIILFQSSARKRGNSNTLAEQAAAGAAETGAQVDRFFLPGMNIHACSACDACRKTGECVIQDDMQQIYPRLRAANGILLASPVYWGGYSGLLKLCIERWYAVWNFNHDLFNDKPVGIILSYGDSDPYTSGAVNAMHSFESMFRFTQSNLAGWVYGSLSEIGDAQKNAGLMMGAYQLGKKVADLASGSPV